MSEQTSRARGVGAVVSLSAVVDVLDVTRASVLVDVKVDIGVDIAVLKEGSLLE